MIRHDGHKLIRHDGHKWVLYSHDGSTILGRHDTEAEAEAQEHAIEAAKHAHMAEALDVEIFATGEWGGRQWTTADLDTMVRNHQRLAHAVKPVVKLGHSDKQVLAQKDGQPALGWVAGLRRAGEKLVASVQDVPHVLRDMIAKRRYARTSSEIYPAWQGTTWEKNLKSGVQGPVLSAIALLGADVPEVKTLEDLGRVLATEGIAPVTFSEDGPADGAERVEGVAGDAGVSSPSPTVQAIADAVLTTLREAGAFPVNAHPRTNQGAPTNEGAGMTDQEKKALFDEVKASVLADVKQSHDAEITKLTGELTKLSEQRTADKTAHDAEVKRLSDEADAIKARETAAVGRALHAEAVKFAEDALRKPTLFKAQMPMATMLYKLLPTDIAIQADAAKAMGLAEQDWSVRDLFVAFTEGAGACVANSFT